MRTFVLLLALLGWFAPAAADAPPAQSFGHLPYADAPGGDLVAVCEGGSEKNRLRQAAAAAFRQMQADAAAAGVRLRAISCFRSIARQQQVFCGRVCDPAATICKAGCTGRVRTEAERARSSAPPGFSEHHTGFAVDFGDGTKAACDLETCFADTPAGRWLAANAPLYGFELSFPQGNSQGVTYEPWHWRWVGNAEALEIFAWARRLFPASPSVP